MSKRNGHSPSEVFIKTKLELCRVLGLSRPTWDGYTLLDGCPQAETRGWPLERCRAFALERTAKTEERRALELERLRNETAQSTLDLMKGSEEVMPVEWCRQLFAHLALSVCAVIQNSDIAEEDKVSLTEKIKRINADEYLARLRSQTVGATDEDGGATA